MQRPPLDFRATPYAAIGGVDGGICDVTQLTWPSDVDRFKAGLDPVFDATDAGVAACPNLSEGDRASWKAFLAQWKAFRKRKTPTFGSANEKDQACAFAHTLDGWRAKLAKTCTLPGPEKVEGAGTGTLDLVRWGVVGVAVIAGAVVLGMYAPEIKMAVRSIGGRK